MCGYRRPEILTTCNLIIAELLIPSKNLYKTTLNEPPLRATIHLPLLLLEKTDILLFYGKQCDFNQFYTGHCSVLPPQKEDKIKHM